MLASQRHARLVPFAVPVEGECRISPQLGIRTRRSSSDTEILKRWSVRSPTRGFGSAPSILTLITLSSMSSLRPSSEIKSANMADSDTGTTPPDTEKGSAHPQEVANHGSSLAVDKETEKRLMKKLDRRIIPVCCWIYLMNFMDRGKSGTPFDEHSQRLTSGQLASAMRGCTTWSWT
jgi:hypothetical protein